MRDCPLLRLVPLIAACATLNAPLLNAQLPGRLERCVSHPTFTKEIEESRSRATAFPRVRIAAVTFEGADRLPKSVKVQTTARLEEPIYDRDSNWLGASQQMVADALREHGYPHAKVSVTSNVLSSDPSEERVAVAFQISEGPQYRLSEIRFADAHVFPPSELRKHFPLQDGDVFNLAAIRKGIEALTRLYGAQGYINFTAEPDLRPDNKDQRISLLFELGEDMQFRVGSVEVVGLDRPLSGPTLKTKLVPGQVFNPALIEDVFSENKSVLPADASPRDNIEITQDAKHATVTIVFDFTPCP